MKLICKNCGEDSLPYFSSNGYDWYVSVDRNLKGDPCLGAEPSDAEEVRYHFNKIGKAGRIKEAADAFRKLKTLVTFDCTFCGEESCVTVHS